MTLTLTLALPLTLALTLTLTFTLSLTLTLTLPLALTRPELGVIVPWWSVLLLPMATTASVLKSLLRPLAPVASCRVRALPQGGEDGFKLPPGQEGNDGLQKKVQAIKGKVTSKDATSVVGYPAAKEQL